MVDTVGQTVQSLIRSIKQHESHALQLIKCANCHHPVTEVDFKVPINGEEEHQLTNPYGIRFHVMCFSDALGCLAHGDLVDADTWFPGYYWRFAMCENCDSHLGWFYLADDGESFYGLIGSHLIAQQLGDNP